MYVIGFEVTTAASGDVGRQALVFFLGFRKPFLWGAVGWWWALKLSRFGLFAWFGFGSFRTRVRCGHLAVLPQPGYYFNFCCAALRPTQHSSFGLDLAIGHGRMGCVVVTSGFIRVWVDLAGVVWIWHESIWLVLSLASVDWGTGLGSFLTSVEGRARFWLFCWGG